MKNKKTLIIVGVLVVLAMLGMSSYNGMVDKQELATKAAADVQATYQRRADLIPSLVETVKGYAKHEEQTLKEVVEARGKATQMQIDLSSATPEQIKQYQAAQGELGAALGRLIAIQEQYPDLKASEQFKGLQVQLEGTENRINEARQKFNEAVTNYNQTVRRFPGNIMASIFGFDKMEKFEADGSAQKAPEVKF